MGANIKIQSDAKQFQDQMKQVTQDLKLMSSELSVATTKAELFGTEQDKLGAKSKEFEGNLKSQNTLLGLYKNTISALSGDIEKYKNRNAELSKSIGDVEGKLKESIKATGEDSKETRQLQSELSKLQKEFNSNEKAIDRSNKQIDNYKIKSNECEKAILQTKKALEDTDKKLAGMKWDKASKDLEKFGNKTKDIGENLSAKVTLPILGAGVAALKFASDVDESTNKVDVAFKDNANEVKEWSNTTLDKFGIAKGSALDMASLFGDMGTAMGLSTGEASGMSTSLVGLAGDLSSFKNIGIEEAQTALKGIFTGEGESLKSLGVIMQDATLKEYAHATGQKKKYEEMTQAEKVQLRYNFVMEQTKNAQGDFARTSDGVANQSRITKESVKQLSAEFGQNLLPITGTILKSINEFLKSLTKMTPEQQKIVIGIGAVMAIIPPLLIIIGKISLGISAVTGAIGGAGGLGAVLTALTGPIGIVIGAIVGLIAIFTTLYKNNEDFRNNVNTIWNEVKTIISGIVENIKIIISTFVQIAKEIWQKYGDDIVNVAKTAFNLISDIIKLAMNVIKDVIQIVTGIISGDWSKVWQGIKNLVSDVWNGISGIIENGVKLAQKVIETGFGIAWDIVKRIFEGIKNAIMKPIDFAVEHVKGAVEKMANFFKNLKIELPKIKLPHFSLEGELSLKNMTVPSINIDWYKDGGIMTKPTLFGFNGNSAMVGGEAGAEGIIPLEQLWNNLNNNFDKLEQRLNNKQQIIKITNITTLNSREIARETVEYNDEELTRLNRNREAAYGGVFTSV